MCLLPPNCLFCLHYHREAGIEDSDCDAFDEIPDVIFAGGHRHQSGVAGDQGIRFALDPELQEEYEEVEQLRRQIRKSA